MRRKLRTVRFDPRFEENRVAIEESAERWDDQFRARSGGPRLPSTTSTARSS